jgi:large subunit ribosomal protein L21
MAVGAWLSHTDPAHPVPVVLDHGARAGYVACYIDRRAALDYRRRSFTELRNIAELRSMAQVRDSPSSSKMSENRNVRRVRYLKRIAGTMFAIVRTGGKQYRVAAGDKIAVEKLAGEAGETITLSDILLAGVDGALSDPSAVTVSAEIIAQAKSEKVVVFKKRRRHNYRRKNGHRQQLTLLRIVSVA